MSTTPSTSSRLNLTVRDSKLGDLGTRLFFVGVAIVWILLTVWLDLWPESSRLSKIFLMVPVIVCITNALINFDSANIVLNPEVTTSQFTSYVLIASSIISPWLNNILDRRKSCRVRVIRAFVVMLLLLILGQLDLLALRKNLAAEVFWESGILTASIGLLGYCVSQFLFLSYEPKPVSSSSRSAASSKAALIVGAQISTLPTR